MKMRALSLNIVFCIIIVFCIFQDYISSILPIFKYYDEILTAMAIPVFLMKLAHNSGILKSDKFSRKLSFCVALYVVMGMLSYLFNSTQPLSALFGDLYLNLKFFFAIYIGYSLLISVDINKQMLGKVISTITFFLAALLIINFIHPIFQAKEVRFGITVPKLFFSHSSYLASAGTIMLIMMYRFFRDIRHSKVLIFLQIFILFASLRYKAMATAIISVLILYVVVIENSRLKFRHYCVASIGILLLAWDQISLYYGSAEITNNARGALTLNSFTIANDFFPFGAGFGTYASYMSKVHYSAYYYMYGLSGMWGISKNSGSYSFISDSFWPMIIGQSGWLGLCFYVLIVWLIYSKIKDMRSLNKYSYLSSMCALAYLLIESTSSSAFVSPQAIPFGIWIGVMLAEYKKDCSKYAVGD